MHVAHYWGMHWIWWIIWVIFLIWIFATPWDIPGQRKKETNAMEVLQKRLASGEISDEEFERIKSKIED